LKHKLKKEPREEYFAVVKHEPEEHFTLNLPPNVNEGSDEEITQTRKKIIVNAEPHELRIANVRSEAIEQFNVKHEPEECFTLAIRSDLKQEDTDIILGEIVDCYSFEDEETHSIYPFVNFDDAAEQEADEHLYPCEHCNQTFGIALSLIDHFNAEHSELKISGHMTAPRSIHNFSNRERQFLCDICGKSYTQSSHLWQHMRFHNGVKPHSCKVDGCDRAFTIKPDLNDHIRKFHTGERPYL
jgi:hypothetical protein